MKKRTFLFDCSGEAGKQLIEILKRYTDAAYPIGGSDCAATSRQGLFDIIDTIEKGFENDDIAMIGRRQRPILKAAVKWFCSETAQTDHPMKDLLLDQLS